MTDSHILGVKTSVVNNTNMVNNDIKQNITEEAVFISIVGQVGTSRTTLYQIAQRKYINVINAQFYNLPDN